MEILDCLQLNHLLLVLVVEAVADFEEPTLLEFLAVVGHVLRSQLLRGFVGPFFLGRGPALLLHIIEPGRYV